MKKIPWMTPLALSTLLLVACGDDEAVTNAPNDAPTEQNENNNASSGNSELGENAPFQFTSFSLDVKYSNTESYEVDYDNEQSGVEASIEDLTNKKTSGNDAFTQLEPIFKGFTFDATTANDEVVAEVLKAFKLDDSYQEFELEIRFADGAEKEYHAHK